MKRDVGQGWKTAVLVKKAILDLIEKFGVDNVGMYTFTFGEDLDYKEASRRWDSFNSNVLAKRYQGAWVKVLELTKRGRPHYHVILVVPGIREGAVIERKQVYGASGDKIEGKYHWKAKALPGSILAQERRFFAETLPAYGFGTWNDISPILASAEAAASYAAKYVVKSFDNRPESLKGARLVSFGKGVKPGSTNFTSVGGRAAKFRLGLALLAEKHNLAWDDLPTWCDAWHGQPGGKYVGHRWAYFLRREIENEVWEFEQRQPF